MDDPEKFEDEIRAVLSDKKRPGAPSVFTPDQIMRIIDLACSSPNDFDLNMMSAPCQLKQIRKV